MIQMTVAVIVRRVIPLVLLLWSGSAAHAQERFRVSYGGFNETATSMWVGIERGMFKKYGIDAQMVQVRNGALSIATLVAKEVEAVWPAQSTILSTVSGGIKLTCIGGPVNKIPRNLAAPGACRACPRPRIPAGAPCFP